MKNTFLICAILLLLCSCGQKAPVYRIGVSQCSDDEWRHQMNNEILREALLYGNVEVEIRSAHDYNHRQISDIRYFIDEGFDLIVVAPNEAAPITPIVEEAYNKGIPVITIDRMILSDKFTAFVGADNFEIGKSVGEYVITRFPDGARIVELTGLSGSTPAIDRHQGFTSVINRHPSMQLLCSEDAGWNYHTAGTVMESILVAYPAIDLVFCQNDRMAAGAYQSVLRAGREKEMAFIGIDALPGEGYGLDLVLNDILTATFIYPTGGDRVMKLAMDILEGKPYEKENILHTAAIGKTNARVMKLQTDHISNLDSKIKILNTRIDSYLDRFANQQILLYAAFTILLLFMIVVVVTLFAYRTKTRLNAQLSQRNREITSQKEQLETQRDQLIELSQQLEEATHAKLVFFTNISHDIRTPLTLISGPVNQLLSEGQLNPDQKMLLSLAQRNINTLLHLVNQLLDFRKYENGKLDLMPVKCDLEVQLKEWVSAFTGLARSKHIKLNLTITPGNDYEIIIDLGKIERVCYNLLSNAFKFTPENGRITVNLTANENQVTLSVEDNGTGIDPGHLQNIFERFYMTEYRQAGSGIGLALSKAFVELHKGRITVESEPGKGSIFTLVLPRTQENHIEIENQLSQQEVQETFAVEQTGLQIPVTTITEENEEELESGETILIIDDNKDVRAYVHFFLGKKYRIIEAENGKEGVKKAMKFIPDLIICDILMPVMDGLECLQQLKNEPNTSHIPVIMLTACTLDEQRIKGFETGADSYIPKPFNSDVLESRVRNLLTNRQRLQQVFGDPNTLSRETINDVDKEFIRKFRKLIEENISNSSYSVEDMGEQMGMSRVQLYRKIKSLTNFSPNELLRITRLKKAAMLLTSSPLTVAEITYEVGFTSPSYFTKCYKEYYGEIPTTHQKKGK